MPEVLYEVSERVARLTLNRPERGNGITRSLLDELERLVEQADLDPEVRVLLLAGAGNGFCGGYDLVVAAEGQGGTRGAPDGEDDAFVRAGSGREVPGSPLDPAVIRHNHDPRTTWDPMVDYAMMSRNVRAFTSLVRCTKPVVCKVHGFCVAGGTDLALCADLLLTAEDTKIGYPPARVWGSPTTALWAYRLGPQRAKRLLPLNQLQMMKLLCNHWYEGGSLAASQVLGTLFDGMARHTAEGFEFQQLAAAEGFREAVRRRDEPFGDFGR